MKFNSRTTQKNQSTIFVTILRLSEIKSEFALVLLGTRAQKGSVA